MANDVLKGKRILFVHGTLDLGGAERQSLHLARHLKENCGAEVIFWGLYGKPGRAAELCDEYGIAWQIVPCALFALNRWVFFKAAWRLGLRLRWARPDIILSYGMQPNLLCALGWRLSRAKGFFWNQRDAGLARRPGRIERVAVRLTPCFVSNSRHGAIFLQEGMKVPATKIRVIHNGIKQEKAPVDRVTWRQLHGIAPSAFVACMVANLHVHKDHTTLLQAWAKVVQACGVIQPSPVLLLAGRFDGTTEQLKAQAFDLQLGASVRFLGSVADIPSLRGASDLAVFSSHREGMPNGVLEAMAAGLPVVATDIPGIREALGSNNSRWFCPPCDAESMAQKLLEMQYAAELRENCGTFNLDRIRDAFSIEQMIDQFVGALQSNFTML